METQFLSMRVVSFQSFGRFYQAELRFVEDGNYFTAKIV
jgi:hypothetical protein